MAPFPRHKQLPELKRQRRDALRVHLLAVIGMLVSLTLASLCSGQCAGGVCYGPPTGWRSTGGSSAASGSAFVDTQASDAMCRVVVETPSGRSLGSGTLVGVAAPAGYVLTCGHLFDDGANRVTVVFANGQRFEASIAAADRPNDVALLKIAAPAIKPIPTGDAVRTGATLTACGFGGAGRFRAVRGTAIGYATPIGATHTSVRIRGAVRSGDSGGPVLDAAGRLVGVVWGVREGVTYAAFGEPVRRLLAGIGGRIARRPEPSTAPLTTPVTPRAEPTNGSDSRLAAIESRLAETTPCRCPDDVVTRGDLALFVTKNDLVDLATTSDLSNAVSSLRTSAEQQTSRFDSLREQAVSAAKSAAVDAVRERLSGVDFKAFAMSKTQVVLASLGVGGPIGLAMLAGRLWLRTRRRRRRDASRGQGGPRRRPFRRR